MNATDETGLFGVGDGPGVAPGRYFLVRVHFDAGMNCTRNVALEPTETTGGFCETVRTGLVGIAVAAAPGRVEPVEEAPEPGTTGPDGVAPADPDVAGPRPGRDTPVNMSVAAATNATTTQKPTNQSQNGTVRR